MTSLRFLPEQIEQWPLARLKPYERNPRLHSEDQVARLAASLVEFGWTQPVLIADDGTVIAGHGRLLAAQHLGLSDVPVIRLQHLTETQVRAYRIGDNQLALAASWDEEALSAELHALNGEAYELALLGFDDGEIERLLAPLDDDAAPVAGDADDAALDETPAPPRDPVSRPGDLWLLGEHRLLCADATDPAAVSGVMGREQAALTFTSPPYAGQRDYTTGGIGDWDRLMQGVLAQLPMRDDGQVLVNLGLVHRDNEWLPYWQGWLDWMRGQGWRRFGLYVWDQGAGMPGDWAGRFAPAFELVFHFNRQARKPNKIVPCKTAGEIGHAPGTAGMRRKDGSFNTWTHGGEANYSTTSTIITKLAALAPNTVVWGYIDIGVNPPAGNYSLSTLQTQIDQWLAIGAKGIFCDDYGYDFGVTRARQNSVLDYIHGKGVGAMMNAWNIADALSPAIDATYNPSGAASHADARDVYLLESWVFNSDAWASPYYATFWDLKTRGDDARTWRSSSGVRMYAVNIMQHSGTSNETLDAYRGMAEALAHIWRLDGLAVAMSNYVATGADIGLVKPYPPLIRPMPGGRLTAPYTLNGAWTEVQAADLGLTVHFEPGNYSWTAS